MHFSVTDIVHTLWSASGNCGGRMITASASARARISRACSRASRRILTSPMTSKPVSANAAPRPSLASPRGNADRFEHLHRGRAR